MVVRCVLLMIAVAAGVPGRAGDQPAVEARQFAGRWILDAEKSDDGPAKLREAMDGRRRPAAGRPGSGGVGPMSNGPVGGGVPRGAGGREFGAPPSPERMEGLREAMHEAVQASPSLTISQQGVSFEIVTEDGTIVRLYSDGRKNRGSGGGAIERTTKWKDGSLVTEARLGAGGMGPMLKIVETWTLDSASPEPTQRTLTIATRLEGGMLDKPLDLKRVYDQAPAP